METRQAGYSSAPGRTRPPAQAEAERAYGRGASPGQGHRIRSVFWKLPWAAVAGLGVKPGCC